MFKKKTAKFSKFQSMTDKPCSFGPVAKQQIAAGMHEEGSLFSSKLLQKKEQKVPQTPARARMQ